MNAVHSIAGALAPEDCDAIAAMAARAPARPARGPGPAGLHDQRRAALIWVDDLPGGDWVMDKLTTIMARANREAFGVDLTDFAESAQIARDDAAGQGQSDWHADQGGGRLARMRRLTLVVQLSDPAAYAGGALEIRAPGQIVTAPRDLGTATVFPASLPHRVTPVTAGSRLSLNLWAHGPALR